MGTYAPLALDTALQPEHVQVELWRRKSPLKKASAVSEVSRCGQVLALAGNRLHHPGASERECMPRLAFLKLGRSLACRVYPGAEAISGH